MMVSEHVVDAFLFDMDGTLVSSTIAADYTFTTFKARYNIIEPDHPHGIRMVDTCKKWFPEASPTEIQNYATEFELELLDNAKDFVRQGKVGIVVLPGVHRLLDQIQNHASGEKAYTICTSASRKFAAEALATAGLPVPKYLVASDDCKKGKPDPEPYLNGASALGKDIKTCVVVEDAPAGIKAGVAAGAITIGVCTSHTRQQLEGLGATHVVDTLESLLVTWTDKGRMQLRVTS